MVGLPPVRPLAWLSINAVVAGDLDLIRYTVRRPAPGAPVTFDPPEASPS